MKISFIIPSLNEAHLITRAIDRAWEAGCDEVIVTDGGSKDETPVLARQKNCLFTVSAPSRGAQLNRGAELATGDLLVFLHADNWLGPNVCDQLRAAPRLAIQPWGGFRQRIENSHFQYRLIEHGNTLRVRWQGLVYGDQGMFVMRDQFEQIAGFPEIPLMEDFEISKRLTKHCRPLLLPGPIHVADRRWKQQGVIRQTLKNWSFAFQYRLGRSPESLARQYRGEDG